MLFTGAGKLLQNIYIFTWDAFLALYNFVTPNKKVGTIVPKGCPGAGGTWPAFVAPKEGDSRSACPALNAMANHGMYPPRWASPTNPLISSPSVAGILPHGQSALQVNVMSA